MVRKRKTASLLNQSAQIDPLSAHIAPHITPPLSSGTLPLGESGCIPERPLFIKATPAPTYSTPQSVIPLRAHPHPPLVLLPTLGRGSNNKRGHPLPGFLLGCPQLFQLKGGALRRKTKSLSPLVTSTHTCLTQMSITIHIDKETFYVFNDLADGLNAIVNGFNDSDDEHSPDLRLRETYINMMWEYNSTFSLGKLQAAAACLLLYRCDQVFTPCDA